MWMILKHMQLLEHSHEGPRLLCHLYQHSTDTSRRKCSGLSLCVGNLECPITGLEENFSSTKEWLQLKCTLKIKSAENKRKFSNATILVDLEENAAKPETSCSSHHVECSEAYMRDPCSVFKFRQPNQTRLALKHQALEEIQVLIYIQLDK